MSETIQTLKLNSVTGMKWGWTQWTFLCFMVSDTCTPASVHQLPVLTTALGHNVTMPCQFSHNESLETSPVLYWIYLKNNTAKVWEPSGKYVGRVELLDNNRNSSNKGILLKEVQWADSGKYLCKITITPKNGKSSRASGDGTTLMVYESMIFNLTGHNYSQLQCEVNVTQGSAFVLSIFHDGRKLQTVDSAPETSVEDLPYVTLIEAVSPSSAGKYECQLHLNGVLITKNSLLYNQPDAAAFPQPWPLYLALLLVPSITLLGLIAAQLICRR